MHYNRDMKISYAFVYKEKEYPTVVNRKICRYFYFRWNKEGNGFIITAPLYVTEKDLKDTMKRNLPKIIEKKKIADGNSPIKGDEFYYFGELCKIDGFSSWDEKKKDKYLKNKLKEYVEPRTKECEKEMGIKDIYKIKVRTMKTRFGVNNKRSMSITFSTSLIHYSKEIIDSVIYHELAHHFVMNHSDKFYKVLLKYCPTYKISRRKLIKRIYK